MKVLLTGATGFVGGHLARALIARGDEVLPVSRRPGVGYDWSDASLARGVAEADVVIHLAGENLFGRRWTTRQKARLRSSRIDTTRKLAALVAARRPACFVGASAIGIYGAHESATFDESSPRGAGFLADLCAEWEASTSAARDAGVRTVVVRSGVVLGLEGGALAKMLPPFRLGVGGPLGGGRQWVSWIGVDDLVRMFLALVDDARAQGPFNGTSPEPVTMNELACALGDALHRPAFFRVPGPVLEIALGEVAGTMLTGQRVLPRRALELGFAFEHPEIEAALRHLLARGKRAPAVASR